MKILLLCKGRFEDLPQIMSTAIVLRELGYAIDVVTGRAHPGTVDTFSRLGIKIVNCQPEACGQFSKVLAKARRWRIFSPKVWAYIDRNGGSEVLLWISSGDTVLALGKRLLRYRYILHLRELYDTHPAYQLLLGAYARNATVVITPDQSRAAIFRHWWGLRSTPLVLPNKPYKHPRRRMLDVEDPEARLRLSSIKGQERIILYQGHIQADRDIRPVAEAVRFLKEGWRFVVMGPAAGAYLRELKRRYPEVIYVPKVTAPSHLQITSHAYIGVATYSWGSLNNVFCAPNKVWEYAGFGIPTVCSDQPALIHMVHQSGAGLAVNMEDPHCIVNAIKQIDGDYATFSKAAHQLYDSIDVRALIQNIVDQAMRSHQYC